MSGNAVNPLPRLIRASAYDAGNMRMRDEGRSKWSREDFNESAATQERLIRTCYWREGDEPDSPWPFIRFGIAEQCCGCPIPTQARCPSCGGQGYFEYKDAL